MATSLFYGVCSKSRYDKALPIVEARWNKRPANQQKNICTVAEALSNPDLQKHFLRQRAAISSYYQQARKESRKKFGDISRDVKSLLTPYLFAMADAKPNTSSGGFKQFSKVLNNANIYFINNLISGFKPSYKPSKRRNRIIPFESQLDSWWIKNKNTQLSGWMNIIHQNPKGTLSEAIKDQGKSRLNIKRDDFKKTLKERRLQEGIHEEDEENEEIESDNNNINNNNNTTSSSSSSSSNRRGGGGS